MSLFSHIKNNLSIVDVIGQYVTLRPLGNYMKSSCPFHTEKDASFTVSPDKQIFYCFGCHAHGDVIGFIAKIENLAQKEAALYLAERFSVTIPAHLESSGSSISPAQKERYFALCKAMAQWAHEELKKSKKASDYVTSRNLNQKSIDTFTIGYFPSHKNSIPEFRAYVAQQGFLTKDLIEAGIFAERSGSLVSPFEDRILFPIRDAMGRYCGFGGRIFSPGDQRAKYYNSKDSEGFAKGKLLFGLDLARNAMQQVGHAFLVEGYMDCIAMAQYGYPETIATLGTACTIEHLKILARYVTKLYVLYDGDQAGQNAMLRLTQMCWQVSLELAVIKLPPATDPASLLSSGGDLKSYITNAQDIFSFFINSTGNDFEHKPLAQKLLLAEKIIAVIDKVDNPITRELLLQQASSTMALPIDTVKQFARQKTYAPSPAAQPTLQPEQEDDHSERIMLEENIFSVILNSMATNKQLQFAPSLVPFLSPRIQSLLQKIAAVQASLIGTENFFNAFLDLLDADEQSWVIKKSMVHQAVLTDEMFSQVIHRFCKLVWKDAVKLLRDDLQQAGQNQEQKLLLMNRFAQLKQEIQSRGLL